MKNNRIIRGALAVLLCAVIFAGTFVPVFAENLSGYQVGDVIEYGTYPQSRVTNAKLLEKLNAAPKTWKSYGYYSGDYEGSPQEAELSVVCNGNMAPSDFMEFADFYYGGMRYRAVHIKDYRPSYTFATRNPYYSVQNYNNYNHLTYYFIYEPIRWRVLDPDDGLIMSEMILDSQAYENYIKCFESYGNKYYLKTESPWTAVSEYDTSSIRVWLQNEFIQTAFTGSQLANIKTSDATMLGSVNSYDKIFLPSKTEAQERNYDLAGVDARIASGTDYAKAQGLQTQDGKSAWWLRTDAAGDGDADFVGADGHMDRCVTCNTSYGVRPACRLNTLKNDTEQSSYLLSVGANGDPTVHTGELMMYGTYPQSPVSDSATVSKLNNTEKTWKSYGYYMGNATAVDQEIEYSADGRTWTELVNFDGKMKPRRYMQFADFFCEGVKYRAVFFSEYRPMETGMTTLDENDPDSFLLDNTYQDNNGYDPGTVYYFRYEPILWRVLDANAGLVLSESILDSQSYMTTVWWNYYDPDYPHGWFSGYASNEELNRYDPAIRDWLNYDFYYTAFSSRQQEAIETNVRERSSIFSGATKVTDKVFLLTDQDIRNGSYGFVSEFYPTTSDAARAADTASAYAKCQGLKDNSWMIMSDSLIDRWTVDVSGARDLREYTDTGVGIRCAIKLSDLTSNFDFSDELFSAKDDAASGRIVDPAANGVISISALANMTSADGTDSASDSIYKKLTDFTVSPDAGGFEKYDYNLPYDSAVQGTVTVSSEGYYDYLIPKEVSETLRESLLSCDGVLFARMDPDKGDGKPYVSTVFARKTDANSAYKEISKGFFTFGENEQFDLIVSAGRTTGAVTYWLYQDDAHKLSSSTGYFNAVKLAEAFSDEKDLYVYVTCGGVNSDAVKLLIEKAVINENEDISKMVNDGEFKATGALSGINFSDPEFLKYAKFDLSAFKIPVDFSFHDNRMRFSLGVSIWNATKPTSWEYGSGAMGGSAKDKKDWAYSNYKKDFQKFYSDSSNGGVAKNFSDSVALKEKYDKSAFSSLSTRKNMFDVSALGYVEFEYRNDHWVCCEGSLSVCLSYSFSITQQGWIGPVPEYSYLQFKVEFSVGGTMSFPLGGELTFDGFISLTPSLTVGGGVGFKDLLSFGIWGSVSMPIVFTFREKHLKIDLTGSFGIEAGFCYIFKYKQALFSGTETIADKYWGKRNRNALATPGAGNAPPDGELDSGDIPLTLADRDYAASTSGWLGGADGSGNSPMLRNNALTRMLPSAGMNTTTLQTNVFEGSTPQIAAVGDTMVMTFVQDDPARDDYNRMRLVYSVYDPAAKTWSAPQPVCDDGFNDVYPVLKSDGANAYVAWQKICRTLDETTDSTDDICDATEIYLAKFNAATGAFEQAAQITDDHAYNYAQTLGIMGGKPVVYYAACTDNNLRGTENTELRRYSDGETATLLTGKNYIHQLETNADGSEFTYLMDADGAEGANDVNAYIWRGGAETAALQDSVATYAVYAEIDGTQRLLLADHYNIYEETDGAWTPIFDHATNMTGGVHTATVNGETALCWLQNDGDGTNNMYYAVYRDGAWSERVQVSAQDELISYVNLTGFDGRIYGALMQTEQTSSAENETVDSRSDLCVFTLDDFADLEMNIISANEGNLYAGQDSEIDVTVRNNGTLSVKKIKFTIRDGLGTDVSVIKDVDLAPGEQKNVTLVYPVPAELSKTNLSVTAAAVGLADANNANHTDSVTVGVPDLYFENMDTFLFEDGYLVEGYLYNASDAEAHDVSVSLRLNAEDAESNTFFTCDKIETGQVVHVQAEIKNEDLVFDNEGIAKVFFTATSSDGDSYEQDNTQTVRLYKTAYIDSDGHIYQETAKTDATCMSEGSVTLSCTLCDSVRTQTLPVDPLNGHKYGVWTSVDETQHRRVCEYNSEHIETQSHNFIEKATAPTCDTQGYSVFTCKDCGYTYTGAEVDALGHDFGAWTITREATCTETGEKKRVCSVCSATETETVPVDENAHAWGEEPVKTEPTCDARGYSTYTCERCGATEQREFVDAIGHDMGAWKVTEKATCSAQGEKKRTCLHCDYVETEPIAIEANAHRWDAPVRTAATCEAKGFTTYTCEFCGETEKRNYTEALGHDMSEWTVVKEPTCVADGEKQRTCSRCDRVESESIPLDENAHAWCGWYGDPDATCLEDGVGRRDCALCGATETKVLPAKGHSFTAWTGDGKKAPTCTRDGVERRVCTACGATETRGHEAYGHTIRRPNEDGEGYCSSCGLYVCAFCDTADRYDYTEPTTVVTLFIHMLHYVVHILSNIRYTFGNP